MSAVLEGRGLPSPPLLGLGLLGAVGTAVVVGAPLGLTTPAPARSMLVACALALALAAALAPPRVRRWELLAAGAAALGALAFLAAVPDPAAVAVLVLLLGGLHATRPGGRPFALRLRAQALAALLLGLGWLLVRAGGPPQVGRVGALGLALGLVAAAGLVPYLPAIDSREPAASSCLAWTAFFGPALALALAGRLLPAAAPHVLTAGEATAFGLTLVALGLLNLCWGVVGAWRAADETAAWRYSFLADWGLALVGLGLLLPDGRAAAYLALLSVVVVRLPLYLWARPVLRGTARGRMGPLNVLLAVALTGMAPFAGFPVRLLLLRAATQVAWPLALALLLAMLLWAAHAFRLGRSVGRPRGRTAVGVWLTLLLSLFLGLASSLVLATGGL